MFEEQTPKKFHLNCRSRGVSVPCPIVLRNFHQISPFFHTKSYTYHWPWTENGSIIQINVCDKGQQTLHHTIYNSQTPDINNRRTKNNTWTSLGKEKQNCPNKQQRDQTTRENSWEEKEAEAEEKQWRGQRIIEYLRQRFRKGGEGLQTKHRI